MVPISTEPQAVQKDRPARPQAEQEPEAYPQGYVEDSCELRTMLAGFFNSLLEKEEHNGSPSLRL